MIFEKQVIELKISGLIFCTNVLSETILILRRTERDGSKMYIGVHVKYPLFLLEFKEI
jgi:hypothetical protein